MVSKIAGQGPSLSSLALANQQLLLREQAPPTPSTIEPRDLLGGNKSFNDLEKHLDDVSKGRGYLSSETNKKLKTKQKESGLSLSELNPKLSTLYQGISSGLTYSKNARFISGMDQVIKTAKRLNELA